MRDVRGGLWTITNVDLVDMTACQPGIALISPANNPGTIDTIAAAFTGCGEVYLRNVKLDLVGPAADGKGANKLTIDATTGLVVLEDCAYTTLASSAGRTQIRTNGRDIDMRTSAVDTTLTGADYYLTMTVAAKTATLPASPHACETFEIKAHGVSTTIAGNGHNIDGSATFVVTANDCAKVRYNSSSTEWELC
jgi:hypothetical protein